MATGESSCAGCRECSVCCCWEDPAGGPCCALWRLLLLPLLRVRAGVHGSVVNGASFGTGGDATTAAAAGCSVCSQPIFEDIHWPSLNCGGERTALVLATDGRSVSSSRSTGRGKHQQAGGTLAPWQVDRSDGILQQILRDGRGTVRFLERFLQTQRDRADGVHHQFVQRVRRMSGRILALRGVVIVIVVAVVEIVFHVAWQLHHNTTANTIALLFACFDVHEGLDRILLFVRCGR
mmetsp:Transcript_11273/g.32408  ORF Transcript_11273/g.32408 Transcript_11273/m.32408 type:complete len:236 (+) Transcript_11273:998-1705(+)